MGKPLDSKEITKDLLFARQPIFDSKKKLYGFELLYRDNDPNSAIFDDGDKATASLIMNYCGSILEDEVNSYVKIFINLTKSLILSDLFFPLDPKRIVIEILEDTIIDQELIDRIIALKKQGYHFALDDFAFCDSFEPILPLMSYIKVEVLDMPAEKLTEKLARLNQEVLGKLQEKPILLAEKVEDQAVYSQCSKLGFQLFQGYFLERPLPVYGTKIDNNSETAIQILSQLQNPNINLDDLSHSISRDAKLSYQILKIVNSPLCRLPKKVSSLHEAVVFLGLQQVKKWAMAMALAGSGNTNKELFMLLLTRARCCELVSTKLKMDDPDSCFTVGLFSGIDAVLLADKKWLLDKLDLTEDINEAILNLKGEKGRILQLVIELEHQDLENIVSLDSAVQRVYYESLEEALKWTQLTFKNL